MHYYLFLGLYMITLKPSCAATMNYRLDHYRVTRRTRPISDKVDCNRGEVDKPPDQGAQPMVAAAIKSAYLRDGNLVNVPTGPCPCR
jgi:hypothetical protein